MANFVYNPILLELSTSITLKLNFRL